jgi:hypothetical protein
MLIFDQGRSLQNEHSALLIHYPMVRTDQRTSFETTELGITPLLLYTCGIPIGKSMNQSLISALFPASEISKESPVRYVDSYPRVEKQLEPGHLGEFNDLLVEQMKSLGYLQ